MPACDKDDDDNNNNNPQTSYTLSGNATGSQEVPAVSTSGTGSLSGNYNSNTNLLNYTINWSGLTGPVNLMHFHGPAAVGLTASPVVTITGFTSAASGSVTGSATLTDAQETDLLGGKWYYNLHTALYPNGEIRAQVVVQ